VPFKVREVIKKLETDGRITVVSGRLDDDVRPGTYRAILKQAGIEEGKT